MTLDSEFIFKQGLLAVTSESMGTKLTVQSKLNANEKCGLYLRLTDRLNIIIAVNWEGKQQTQKSNPH